MSGTVGNVGNPLGTPPLDPEEAGGEGQQVEAALDRLSAVDLNGGGKIRPQARTALVGLINTVLADQVGATVEKTSADDVAMESTIRLAATEIVAHFSEAPPNWCGAVLASRSAVLPALHDLMITTMLLVSNLLSNGLLGLLIHL
eukprot:SAG31_NODE_24405_length_482_cov_0.843342_1_plen_144_part_10